VALLVDIDVETARLDIDRNNGLEEIDMPTPKGLPKAGDKLRYKKTGRVFTVVSRSGGTIDCSVILKADDGEPVRAQPVYGYEDTHFRLTECMWWIGRTYEYVTD
jgi:hypothetical protein